MSAARRNLLVRLVKACVVVVVIGFAVVLFASIWPAATSQRVSIYVDTSNLKPGEHLSTTIGNLPILVVYRTDQQIASLDDTRVNDAGSWQNSDPADVDPKHRGVDDRFLVVEALGTALQCPVAVQAASSDEFQGKPWVGGLVDQCRGERYDWAGRVYRDQTAKRNLRVLPHAINDRDELTVSLP